MNKIKGTKVLIECEHCGESYWYHIHPASMEYLRCGGCGSLMYDVP